MAGTSPALTEESGWLQLSTRLHDSFVLARSHREGKFRRMTVLTTSLDRRSDVFAANAAAMRALVGDLREKLAAIEEGGGEAARRRHLGRGKLLPRERVRALLDPGSPFLEFSPLA